MLIVIYYYFHTKCERLTFLKRNENVSIIHSSTLLIDVYVFPNSFRVPIYMHIIVRLIYYTNYDFNTGLVVLCFVFVKGMQMTCKKYNKIRNNLISTF